MYTLLGYLILAVMVIVCSYILSGKLDRISDLMEELIDIYNGYDDDDPDKEPLPEELGDQVDLGSNIQLKGSKPPGRILPFRKVG